MHGDAVGYHQRCLAVVIGKVAISTAIRALAGALFVQEIASGIVIVVGDVATGALCYAEDIAICRILWDLTVMNARKRRLKSWQALPPMVSRYVVCQANLHLTVDQVNATQEV